MSIYRLFQGVQAANARRKSEAARTQAFLAVAARMTRNPVDWTADEHDHVCRPPCSCCPAPEVRRG